MKKILLFTSALALLAGCAQDDFESVRSESAKGISFAASIGNEASTRGELTMGDQVGFFWYAETDRISIWANNNISAGSGNTSSNGVVSAWGTISTTPATYKATKSAGNGQFTAASDADMLTFTALPAGSRAAQIKAATASFVATYGASATKVDADATTDEITAVTIKPASSNATITLAAGENISKYIPMYSVSTAYPTQKYHSVGEKVNLEFYRPFATLGLIANGVEQYKDQFGILKKITITTNGFSTTIPASEISYGTDTEYKIDLTAKHDLTKTKATTPGTQTKSIVVDYTAANLKWKDGKAGAQVIPALSVDRSTFRTAGKKEKYTVKYEFADIAFTVVDSTDTDWNAFNTSDQPVVKALKTLDINDYPYLLTNSGSLIVNSGSFSDVFGKDATKATIAWGGSTKDISSVKEIISKVALTTAELGDLTKFTGLTKLNLAENTTIPAKTFTTAQAAQITSLVLPKVTSIDAKFIDDNPAKTFTALTNVALAAYEFPTPSVNNAFFNATTASKLITLDISAVKSMIPAFGLLRELSFTNFTALKSVKVFEGVQLSSSAFDGCTSLETVNGTVKIDGAVAAFKECNAAKFTAIKIIGTDVPDNAFNGCTNLKSILVSGSQIVPTTVGEAAFKGTAVEYMDLSQVTKLGKQAFMGATKLVSANKNTQILTVGAEKIAESAFENTKVVMVDFANATSFEKDILKGTGATLKQVRFLKKFTVANGNSATYWTTTFGAATNVNLFVADGQSYVSSNKLQLPYKIGSAAVAYEDVAFKGIYKN